MCMFWCKKTNFAVCIKEKCKLCVVASIMQMKVLLEKLDTFINKNIYFCMSR